MDDKTLLERLDKAESDSEIRETGRLLLEADPNSPYGKLAVWETMEYDEGMENLDMLREALDTIRAVVDARDTQPDIEEDRDAQTYCTIMMDLGYALLARKEEEEALAVAREAANFDDEGLFPSHTLLYICMLNMQMYNDILTTLEGDPQESVAGEHARVIAMIETKADSGDIRDAMNYAFSLNPDVAFYILNIWDLPEPEEQMDDDMEETLNLAMFLSEPWCANDERIAVLSAPTFLFGYLTERLDDKKDIALLEKGYESIGVLNDVRDAKGRIKKMADDNKEVEEIDSAALGETAQINEKIAVKAESEKAE